jgi:hypothetical protein
MFKMLLTFLQSLFRYCSRFYHLCFNSLTRYRGFFRDYAVCLICLLLEWSTPLTRLKEKLSCLSSHI